MKLSALQKFIINQSYDGKKVSRRVFDKFYNGQNHLPKSEDQIKNITKSLERLISKGLIVGFGELTQHKWYIDEIKLTPGGRRVAKKMMGEQTILPFKVKR